MHDKGTHPLLPPTPALLPPSSELELVRVDAFPEPLRRQDQEGLSFARLVAPAPPRKNADINRGVSWAEFHRLQRKQPQGGKTDGCQLLRNYLCAQVSAYALGRVNLCSFMCVQELYFPGKLVQLQQLRMMASSPVMCAGRVFNWLLMSLFLFSRSV